MFFDTISFVTLKLIFIAKHSHVFVKFYNFVKLNADSSFFQRIQLSVKQVELEVLNIKLKQCYQNDAKCALKFKSQKKSVYVRFGKFATNYFRYKCDPKTKILIFFSWIHLLSRMVCIGWFEKCIYDYWNRSSTYRWVSTVYLKSWIAHKDDHMT